MSAHDQLVTILMADDDQDDCEMTRDALAPWLGDRMRFVPDALRR